MLDYRYGRLLERYRDLGGEAFCGVCLMLNRLNGPSAAMSEQKHGDIVVARMFMGERVNIYLLVDVDVA